MVQYRGVGLTYSKRRYNGAFHEDGDEVVVYSAYGSARAEIGNQEPKAVAEKLLLKLAKASGK
jgi:hypothetical protein